MKLIDIIALVLAVFLITLVAVQTSADDAASALSGEKSELFLDRKERGLDVFMTRLTGLTAIAFILVVFIATFYTKRFM